MGDGSNTAGNAGLISKVELDDPPVPELRVGYDETHPREQFPGMGHRGLAGLAMDVWS